MSDSKAKGKEKGKQTFTVICGWCSKPFQASRDRARWCSDACRVAAYRERKGKGLLR